MKRALLVGVVGLAIAAATVTAVLAGGGPQDSKADGVHGPRPAPDCTTLVPACPSVQPPAPLQAATDYDTSGFQLLPPPAEAKPNIDGYEAADIAWQEQGYGGDVQQPTLALIPAGGTFSSDTLAWLIIYPGACSLPVGAIGSEGTEGQDCLVQPGYTLIDAQTGEFLVSWT
jgi:hypothetical protein